MNACIDTVQFDAKTKVIENLDSQQMEFFRPLVVSSR
jgi:hypothetical protein